MILMPQIFDVTANENARYKRNELEWFFDAAAAAADDDDDNDDDDESYKYRGFSDNVMLDNGFRDNYMFLRRIQA